MGSLAIMPSFLDSVTTLHFSDAQWLALSETNCLALWDDFLLAPASFNQSRFESALGLDLVVATGAQWYPVMIIGGPLKIWLHSSDGFHFS